MKSLEYLHLLPGHAPPRLEGVAPFKMVVVIDADVTPEWQGQVSGWLVEAGCRYMMAWGKNCSDWDSSVDEANLAVFDFEEVPEDASVMTTWHDGEPLDEVFWFSEFCAMHPSLALERTYILHIAPEPREVEMLKTFRDAQAQPAS